MKKPLLLFLFLTFIFSWSFAQWAQKADYPGVCSSPPLYTGAENAVGFSIGNRGYVGLGRHSNCGSAVKNDFWEYDPATNTWTQKSDYPGVCSSPPLYTGAENAIGFSIGNKGYVGLGRHGNCGSIVKNDFYEYDPAANTWTKKADYPGVCSSPPLYTGAENAIGFSIGNKGYVGLGRHGNCGSIVKNDFWEYDPATDTWIKKADYRGVCSSPPLYTGAENAIGFSIGNKGYIGLGSHGNCGSIVKNDFYEYDSATDTWTKKADYPGVCSSPPLYTGAENAIGFSIGNKGYVGLGRHGNCGSIVKNDFWEYDPATNTWTKQADYPGVCSSPPLYTGAENAIGFSIDKKGYVGLGRHGNCGSTVKNDFWEFNPCYPFDTARICMVTVDSLSNYNVIVWDKTLYPKADSFIIYREYTTNNYVRLGSVSKDSLSLFVDTLRTKYFPITGDPNITSYRYKMQILDKCGDYGPLGPYHNTVHMVNNFGNFSWNFYTIENTPNQVTFYLLKRDNLSNGNWITIAGVSGSQNGMTDPQYSTWAATANWRIETQWAIQCTPSIKYPEPQTIKTTKSNTFKTANPTSVSEITIEDLLSVYPNPSSGKFIVQVGSGQLAIGKSSQLKIYDILGQLIYAETFTGNEKEINVEMAKGVYQLSVQSEQGSVSRKIIIQ